MAAAHVSMALYFIHFFYVMFIFLLKKSKPRESHEQVQSLGFVAAEDFGVMRPLEPSPIQQTWHFLGEKTG